MEIFKVLLADDDIIIAEIASRVLEKYNFKVDHVMEGRTAGLKLKQGYDLVITDIMMPIVDGFTFIEKNYDALKTIPIIMLTAQHEKDNILRAASLKVFHYLVKPFKPESLLQKVSDALQIDRNNLVLKENFKLKIAYEILAKNKIRTIISGYTSRAEFQITFRNYLHSLSEIISQSSHLLVLYINKEFYYTSDSYILIDEFLELYMNRFKLKEEHILLKGDYFSKISSDELQLTKIIKKLIPSSIEK
jgi:DNA-binding response OmpR family regulator